MMTEEEAKQKWCPQSRACIASRCMSWRWAVAPDVRNDWNDRYPNNLIRAEGFCGLAGRSSEWIGPTE